MNPDAVQEKAAAREPGAVKAKAPEKGREEGKAATRADPKLRSLKTNDC